MGALIPELNRTARDAAWLWRTRSDFFLRARGILRAQAPREEKISTAIWNLPTATRSAAR